MFCPHCGAPNQDGSARCGTCGGGFQAPTVAPPGMMPPPGMPAPGMGPPPGYNPYAAPPLPNYMTWAVVLTVFHTLICNPIGLPLAIVGIVFANQVSEKQAHGDLAGAQAASGNAKLCTIISAVFAGITVLIGCIYLIAVVAIVSSQPGGLR